MKVREVLDTNNGDWIEVSEKEISEGLTKDFAKLVNGEVEEITIVQGSHPCVLVNKNVAIYSDANETENFVEYKEFYELLGLPIPVKLIIRDL
jgi:hypothetical protein